MEPFKNKINNALIEQLARQVHGVWSGFDTAAFIRIATTGLAELELKARINHVTHALGRCLPADYPRAIDILLKTLPPPFESESGWGDTIFVTWIHAHFVRCFGLDDVMLSLNAMVEITQRGSCEFAVRPYLLKHRAKTRAFLEAQLTHESPHVRRWISEGTRPRLPWGERLDDMVADPAPNIFLLEALRRDKSRYVQTSVANHIGDIAKDHPELAVGLVSKWQDEGFERANWLASHALRHLIKKGHRGALSALGYTKGTDARIIGLTVDKQRVRIGESVVCSFNLETDKDEKLNVDIGIDFVTARGGMSRKVFKLKSLEVQAGKTVALKKKQLFKPISTRTLYPGEHTFTVLVNGIDLGRVSFLLTS